MSSEDRDRQPVYEIRVRGHLGTKMLRAFPALDAQTQGGDTLLTGRLPDQAAVYGVIAKLEALGLELLELRIAALSSAGRAPAQQFRPRRGHVAPTGRWRKGYRGLARYSPGSAREQEVTSSPEGRTAYIHADLRDPASILNDPVTRDVLDFTQPIALMLVAILHMIPDDEQPAEIVATLVDALPSGSYVVASHLTGQHSEGAAAAESRFREASMKAQWRNSDVFAGLAFGGLDLVPPGVVLTSEWRNDEPGPRPAAADVSAYGGVGRKP